MKLSTFATASIASLLASSAAAAVIDNTVITDLVGAPANFTTTRNLGVTISGDSAVYMVGTMTFNDTAALNSSYAEANFGNVGGYISGFGNGFGGNTITIARNGTRATADTTTFASGVALELVIKYDQTTGQATLWVNPNLGTTEALNDPEASVVVNEMKDVDLTTVVFRGGDFLAPTRVVDFTDFAVYYGGDSPFVPEPSSLALLGLGGLALARRRRG